MCTLDVSNKRERKKKEKEKKKKKMSEFKSQDSNQFPDFA